MEFNKIVKRLSKIEWSVVDHEDILDFVDPGNARWEVWKREAYKLVYALKSQWILIPIKNGLYVVSNAWVQNKQSTSLIIETHYWKIVRKLILRHAQRDGIIVWSKALEIHLKDESIPDMLIVYTMNTNKLVTISDGYKVQFRTVVSGKKEGRENIASFLLGFCERIDIDTSSLRIATKELALLDALLIHKWSEEVDEYLIRKFLKRHSRSISREELGKLVEKKYITSANRLRVIAKEIWDFELYQKTLDTIKREGGWCFVSF